MSNIEIAVISVVAMIMAYYLSVILSGWRQRGKLISDITGADPDEKPGWRVYYFYSPTCGACRNMTPALEARAQQSHTVQCIDVSVDIDTARRFNVRVTPTAVLVENEKVSEVLVGTSLLKRVNRFITEHENDEN